MAVFDGIKLLLTTLYEYTASLIAKNVSWLFKMLNTLIYLYRKSHFLPGSIQTKAESVQKQLEKKHQWVSLGEMIILLFLLYLKPQCLLLYLFIIYFNIALSSVFRFEHICLSFERGASLSFLHAMLRKTGSRSDNVKCP